MIPPYPHNGPNGFEAFDLNIPVVTLYGHTSRTNQEKTMVWFCCQRKKGTLPCPDTNAGLLKKIVKELTVLKIT